MDLDLANRFRRSTTPGNIRLHLSILERLGLSRYLEIFVSEKFDTWETLQDITESDLDALKVKLGHRRKLQRAIVETRGLGTERLLLLDLRHTTSIDRSFRNGDSGNEGKSGKRTSSVPSRVASINTKRKYRRHPKPDEHGPERPPCAYVIFSIQMREALKCQELSFTEIAKIVGERWQVLSPGQRGAYERQAAVAKEKYYSELAKYKKTPQYAAYQEYLADFKAKHATPRIGTGENMREFPGSSSLAADMKRPKLETETSTSTRSSSHEATERAALQRPSGYVEGASSRMSKSDRSPALNSYPTVGSRSTASTSPATYSMSNINSPVIHEQYSALSASPVIASQPRERTYDLPYQPTPQPSEFRDRFERDSPNAEQGRSSHSRTPSTPHTPWQSAPSDCPFQHPSGVESRPRRIVRESPNIPGLSHEETTLSSNESLPSTSFPYQRPFLPPLDANKADRTLPQPVPTPGAIQSPLHPLPPTTTPTAMGSHEYGRDSSWLALLRAIELARDADNQSSEKPSSPT